MLMNWQVLIPSMNKTLNEVCFIINDKGQKTHAILPIAQYKKLIEIQVFLQESKNIDKDDLYYLKSKKIKAKGYPTGQKFQPSFLICKNSQLKLLTCKSLPIKIQQLREYLLANKTIQLHESKQYLYFTQDYEFSSPSLAASLIYGSVKNGLDVWVNHQGFSLKESGFGSSIHKKFK